MQTGEYREFSGPFPDWVRHLVGTWPWPLLISVLLHGLVFWPVALREGPTAEIGATTVTELKAKLQPPQALFLPQAAVVRVSSTRRSSEIKTPHPVGSSARPVRNVPADDVATSRVAVMQPTPGLDAGAVRSYRITLARLLAGGTLRAGLTPDMHGELQIGIAVAANGLIYQVEVVRSSGQAALDAHIVAAVMAAAHEAAIPEPMQGREFVVLLPVEVGSITSAAAR